MVGQLDRAVAEVHDGRAELRRHRRPGLFHIAAPADEPVRREIREQLRHPLTAPRPAQRCHDGRLAEYQRRQRLTATRDEQAPEKLLGALLPKYIEAQILRAMLESSAAEYAARMAAMESATRNAGEVIQALTLHMNKVRQAAITKEIIEIVSGATHGA